jgi:hypothetical protein
MAALLAVIVSVGASVSGCRSQESTTVQTGKDGE